ncbi:unnamed protein product [Gordionus sp. m RMFG-2023]
MAIILQFVIFPPGFTHKILNFAFIIIINLYFISDCKEISIKDQFGKDVEFLRRPLNVGQKLNLIVGPDTFNDLSKNLYISDVKKKRQIQPDYSRKEWYTMDHKKMRIMIPELQTHFDIEKQKNVEILLGLNDTISLQAYNRIEEIYRWLQELEKDYPTKAKVLDLGYTWENRSIKGLILSQDLSIQNKPSVLIIAGEHAREWITTAVALNLIHYLLKDPSSHYMTSQLDWIIFPNVNPDGYEYSFTNTRLWRKNKRNENIVDIAGSIKNPFTKDKKRDVRSDYSTPCIGVDLNRNWDIGWGQEKQFSMIEQISYTNTCSNEFSGPHSFSEPETIAIRNFALKHSDKLVYFLSLHSYGQLIMFPNAYTKDATRELDEFLQIGKAMSKTIEGINGTIYEYGQASVILYIAPGTSMDWIYRYAKVKYSMVIELRNKNEYTFLLPQEQILPTSIEIFTVLKFHYLREDVEFLSKPLHVGQKLNLIVGPDTFNDLAINFYNCDVKKKRQIQPDDSTEEWYMMNHEKMKIMIPELQTHFDIEKQKNVEILLNLHETLSTQAYNRLENIYNWLHELERDYPTKAKVLDIGSTWENRSIKGLLLSQDLSIQDKPSVLIIAGEHAREWIATAVAINLIHYLLKDPTSNYMTSQLDWFIFPIVNPDGYEYSFTTARLWRKNKRNDSTIDIASSIKNIFTKVKKRESRDDSIPCIGVDLNRNWDIGWGKDIQVSLAQQIEYTNTCYEQFSGPHPFSEPETVAVRDFALEHKDKLVFFLSLHSCGQLILFPNAYTNEITEDHEEHMQIGKAIVQTIEAINGTIYEYGQASVILYIAPGSSMDWIYKYVKVKYSMVIELRNKHKYAFLLPQEQISPTSIEIFTALKVLFPEPGKNNRNFTGLNLLDDFIKLKENYKKHAFMNKRSKRTNKMLISYKYQQILKGILFISDGGTTFKLRCNKLDSQTRVAIIYGTLSEPETVAKEPWSTQNNWFSF